MRAVVVYESVYGNTHAVAEAIGKGIGAADPSGEVQVVPVGQATPDVIAGADLVVVGGPTHARGMTRAMSRTGAVEKAKEQGREEILDPDAAGEGLREWFDAMDKAPGTRATAFDTHGEPALLAGGAAHGIGKRLRKHGFTLVTEPKGFVVEGMEGPMRDGELDKAEAWGRSLLQ